VTDHGARVIELIGDEVMYSTPDPIAACKIAVALKARLRAHAVLPHARGGVAAGAVMVRDGDCFGPVVNLATFGLTQLPAAHLKGFDGEVALYEIVG